MKIICTKLNGFHTETQLKRIFKRVFFNLFLFIIIKYINTQRENKERFLNDDISAVILWQAPRAGKMRRILCSYWLPERATGNDIDARDCPFCSRNKISPKSKRVHESFLLQNIFRGSKKIFCDFSVGMELENEKTESVNENENKENKITFAYNWLPFQCSKINKYEDHFFSVLYAI